MRTGLRVVLALALVTGIVWMGQGAGLVGGSFMTGDPAWAVIGAVVSGASALALWYTTARRS